MNSPALLAFDTETTAPDPNEARLVTVFAGYIASDGTLLDSIDLLVRPIDPDGTTFEIPAGSTEVHGVTTDQALNDPRSIMPTTALSKLAAFFASYPDVPIATQNGVYDYTVIERETRRHFGDQAAAEFASFLSSREIYDSLVIDKALDKYRKGSRKLVDLARHYGIPFTEEEAHTASFDAITAARIAQKQIADPSFGGMDRAARQSQQARWKKEQAQSLQAYLRSPKAGPKRDPNAIVDGFWPIIPFATQENA